MAATMNMKAPKARVAGLELVVKSVPPRVRLAITSMMLVMTPGMKPPYQALSRTAGINEIQGALWPTKGLVTRGRAMPTLTATMATP